MTQRNLKKKSKKQTKLKCQNVTWMTLTHSDKNSLPHFWEILTDDILRSAICFHFTCSISLSSSTSAKVVRQILPTIVRSYYWNKEFYKKLILFNRSLFTLLDVCLVFLSKLTSLLWSKFRIRDCSLCVCVCAPNTFAVKTSARTFDATISNHRMLQ